MSNSMESLPKSVALNAASMGYSVFPVDPASKRPLVSNWPNVATTDPEVVRSFWIQFPSAMIGVVTGVKSGLFVLDFDVKDGEDVFEKVRIFEEANRLVLLPTLTVRTPSGGLHFYYRMPEGIDIRNSASKLGEGVDVRANGGYVVFAGSVRADGKKYEIIQRGE